LGNTIGSSTKEDRSAGWRIGRSHKPFGKNLYHHNHVKYELIAYAVMPNHVHVVLQPLELELDAAPLLPEADGLETSDSGSLLSRIMHSLKSYTANRANEILGREGAFWQKESYDHWVRDVEELDRIVNYVAANPVRAGLCASPEDWTFSSAHDRFAQDGSRCALVGWLRDDWKQPVADADSVGENK
jgi:putative DNA methylase